MASPDAFPGKLSPFRQGFLKVELFLGGTWTDITADVADDGVTITRGRQDESRQPEPSRMSLRLRSLAGKYSPRNPSSPYYGQIGRNTPIRVSTTPTAGGTQFFRFWGEVAEWPQAWTVKGEPSVTIECAGVMRKLAQGSSPLRSPFYRAVATIGSNLVGYWPMEDGSDASQLAGYGTAKPMTIAAGSPTLAGYGGFRGSEAIPMLGTGRFLATVPGYSSSGTAQVRFLTAWPVSTPNGAVIARIKASGTLGWVDLVYSTGGAITVNVYSDAGTLLTTNTIGFALTGLNKIRMSFDMTQSGGNINWTIGTVEATSTGGSFFSGSTTGVTLGRITSVELNPNGVNLAGLPVGHLTVEKAITSLFAVSQQVMNGYKGERADVRITRLCTENGLTASITSSSVGDITLLGQQGVDSLLDLLREAATSDGGILFERRTSANLGYRTLEGMWSSTPTAVIAYTGNLLDLEPVDDDQATRNKVTVTRAGGSSATVEDTTSTLSTAAVGVYDDDVTLSLNSDAQAQRKAEWAVHIGTTDEARYPTIGLDLAHPTFRANTGLRDDILTVDVGHTIRITGLPVWLPPFPIRAIVQGYTETITPHSWRIEWNTVPASPYRVAKYGTAGDRWSAEGTVTAATLNATATTFTVVPPGRAKWTSVDGPYDIVINGEQMTVTNVNAAGTGMTVVRSVNGVVKTHAAGSAVALLDPVVYGV